jgi:hypothetical protein
VAEIPGLLEHKAGGGVDKNQTHGGDLARNPLIPVGLGRSGNPGFSATNQPAEIKKQKNSK